MSTPYEADAERDAIVAFLRARANASHPIERGAPSLSPAGRGLLLLMADAIERQDHRGIIKAKAIVTALEKAP